MNKRTLVQVNSERQSSEEFDEQDEPAEGDDEARPAARRSKDGGTSNRRKSKAVRTAERRYRICELYLEGRYMHEIARIVGVSQKTVERDIRAQEQQWLTEAASEFEEARAKELAKINRLERTYAKAWRRSLRAKRERMESRTTKGRDGSEELKRELRRKKSEGNPTFLAGIQWCIAQRCKLLGLDRTDANGAGGAGGNGGGISVLIGVDAAMILGVKKDPRVVEAVGPPVVVSLSPATVAGQEATALTPVEDKEG